MKTKFPEKTVWACTGYLFDRDLLTDRLGCGAVTREYLSYVDVLVDGPFVLEKKDLMLRFRGSANQRIIDVRQSLATGSVVLWQDWQEERKRK
jgi:anaerobic ribonucleoside-triphosphate reductase activating protein